MKSAHGKLWQLSLALSVILAGSVTAGSAGETTKIYDNYWNVKGYVRDDGGTTKKIYDKKWNLRGYIREDRIYDRNWNRTGTLRDSNR
jgi:hypothetical protein